MNDLAVILEQRATTITAALDDQQAQLTQAREVCDRLSAEVGRLEAAAYETQAMLEALREIRSR